MAATSKHTAKRARARCRGAPARSASRERTSSTNRKKRATKQPSSNKKAPGGCTGKGFELGQSGNPAGRIKGRPLAKTILAKLFSVLAKDAADPEYKKIAKQLFGTLEGVTMEQLAWAKQIQKAIKAGDTNALDKMLDRLEGKAPQHSTQDMTIGTRQQIKLGNRVIKF